LVNSKTKLYLDEIINDSDNSEKLYQLDSDILDFAKPNKLGLHIESIEVKHSKDFEMVCHSLAEHSPRNIKELTVKEFYSLLEYVELKVKRMNAVNK